MSFQQALAEFGIHFFHYKLKHYTVSTETRTDVRQNWGLGDQQDWVFWTCPLLEKYNLHLRVCDGNKYFLESIDRSNQYASGSIDYNEKILELMQDTTWLAHVTCFSLQRNRSIIFGKWTNSRDKEICYYDCVATICKQKIDFGERRQCFFPLEQCQIKPDYWPEEAPAVPATREQIEFYAQVIKEELEEAEARKTEK